MVKKKSKSSGSRTIKHALQESKEMENCNCGSADCASCGGEACACGGEGCGGCSGGGCYGGHGSGVLGHLKYVKLVVGLLLLASAVSPQAISTQAAVGAVDYFQDRAEALLQVLKN